MCFWLDWLLCLSLVCFWSLWSSQLLVVALYTVLVYRPKDEANVSSEMDYVAGVVCKVSVDDVLYLFTMTIFSHPDGFKLKTDGFSLKGNPQIILASCQEYKEGVCQTLQCSSMYPLHT